MKPVFSLLIALLMVTHAGGPAAAQQNAALPFFGVNSHFLHTRQIYPDKDDSWLLAKTMPIQRELGNPWVTEQIYALTAKNRALVDDGTANTADKFRITQRRALVDKWLSIYDRNGTRVVLAILASAPRGKNSETVNEDFGDWIAELVSQHNSIKAVQLHNEANLKSFWPASPQDYVDVYRPIANKIKLRNPDVAILVGAISSLSWEPGRKWFRQAMTAGLLDFADGVSVHPYNTTMPPEVDPHLSQKGSVVSLRTGMQKFWEEIKSNTPPGKDLKIYLTELGYSSAPKGLAAVGSEEIQADYLARLMFQYVDFRVRDKIPIEAVFWYDLKNDGVDPLNQEHNFGLVTTDLSRKKPAFAAYKQIITLLPDVQALAPSEDTLTVTDPNVATTAWVKAGAEYVFGVWPTAPSTNPVVLSFSPKSPLKGAVAEVVDVVSGRSSVERLNHEGSRYSFTIPDFNGVKIVRVAISRM